jgi:hypothetical protein
MLALPLFGDQMNNGYRLAEAGATLMLHFREEPIEGLVIAERLERLATNSSFMESIKRLYQISKREGGAIKAADIVEDMFIMFGHLDYLVPANDNVSIFASTNIDSYFTLLLGMASTFYAVVAGVMMLTRMLKGGKSRMKND